MRVRAAPGLCLRASLLHPTGWPTTHHGQFVEATVQRPANRSRAAQVYRFVTSERFLHWSLAIPYVVLYLTALAMLLLASESQPRHWRAAASLAHKVAGLGLIALPVLVALRGRREWRLHLANLREAWTWSRNDLKWLVLSPLAAVNKRVELPEQGKFNAAEKLNFMMVSATYPLYLVTGIWIWLPGAALVPWYAHILMATLGLVLVIGHIYMAAVNPSTRLGLQGMITGWVDREWAKQHYRRWFRDNFERGAALWPHGALLQKPASLSCSKCGETRSYASWETLMHRGFQVAPLFCPKCEARINTVQGPPPPDFPASALHHLTYRSFDEPLAR